MKNDNFIRTNISISKKIKEDGTNRAEELFGGNMSAYISHLIINDVERASNASINTTSNITNKDSSPITTGNNSNNKIKTKVKKEK